MYYWDFTWGCDECLDKSCPLCRERARDTDEEPFCRTCDSTLATTHPDLDKLGCGHRVRPCRWHRTARAALPRADAMCCEENVTECVLCEHPNLTPRAYYDAMRRSQPHEYAAVLERLLCDPAVEPFMFCSVCI